MFKITNTLLILVGLVMICFSGSTEAAVKSYIFNNTIDCSLACDFFDLSNWNQGYGPIPGDDNAGGAIISFAGIDLANPYFIYINGDNTTIGDFLVSGPKSGFLTFNVKDDTQGLIVNGTMNIVNANFNITNSFVTVLEDFESSNSNYTINNSVFLVVEDVSVIGGSFLVMNESSISFDSLNSAYFGQVTPVISGSDFSSISQNTTFDQGINAESNTGYVNLNKATINGVASINKLKIVESLTLGNTATLTINTYIGGGSKPNDNDPVVSVGNGNLLISYNSQDENSKTMVDLYAIHSGPVGVVRITNFNVVNIDTLQVLGEFKLDDVSNATIGGALNSENNAIFSVFNDLRLAGNVRLVLNNATILQMSYVRSEVFNTGIGSVIYINGQTALMNTTSYLNNTIFYVQPSSNFIVSNDLDFAGNNGGIYLLGEMTLNGTLLNIGSTKTGFTLSPGGSLLSLNATINGNLNFLGGLFMPSTTIINGNYYQEGGTLMFIGVYGENLMVSGDLTITAESTVGLDNSLEPDVEAVIHVEGQAVIDAQVVIQMSAPPQTNYPYYLVSSLNTSIQANLASLQVETTVINSYTASVSLDEPGLDLKLIFTSQPAAPHHKMPGWQVFLIVVAVLAGVALIGLGYRYYVRNKGYIAL